MFVRSVLSRASQQAPKAVNPMAALAVSGMNPIAKFHSQRPLRNDAVQANMNKAFTTLKNASTHELYGYSSKALIVGAPVAMILSPSFLNFPVDLALGVVIPLHMHIGVTGIIQDYVPRPQQGLSISALLAISVLTGIGMLKINLCGAGITESVKSLWRAPKKQE